MTTFPLTVYSFDGEDYDIIVEFKSQFDYQYFKEGSDGHKLSLKPINLGAMVNGQVEREIIKRLNI
ncbi:MAG TPA: hypothetical protein VFD46_14255 [Chryseolinea sp.]|nr:hypothetical protein [Chryseolinea sp.]